jgi:3-dehydroquinate synthase
LQEIIKENVSIKAEIVMQDEKEMWIRKYLNLWHTFGHALESVTDFKLTHWVCVWFWMAYVNILSNKLWHLSDKNLEKINSFILEKLEKIDLSEFILDFEEIYKKMLSDKKNNDSNISFILPEKPWKLFIEKIWENRKNILRECFEEFIKKTK